MSGAFFYENIVINVLKIKNEKKSKNLKPIKPKEMRK